MAKITDELKGLKCPSCNKEIDYSYVNDNEEAVGAPTISVCGQCFVISWVINKQMHVIEMKELLVMNNEAFVSFIRDVLAPVRAAYLAKHGGLERLWDASEGSEPF